MTTFDVVVRGGAVVTATGTTSADVGIAGGAIAAIEARLAAGRDEHDATGLLVMPGAVDAHVHLNDPGRADWEGFGTGTAAAAAGGTTTVVDMPLNADPPTVDAAAFDAKLAAATGVAAVDFALWGGLVPGNVGELAELAGRGVVGFKAFMSASGIPDFAAVDDLTLAEGMAEAARLGLPIAVHAESEAITAGLAARARAQGRRGVRDYLASRPVLAEVEAIGRAILLAGETGCALHVVHVSTGRGFALVQEARERGVDVSCETCPHYLVLDEADAERLGAIAKCAPPLRSRDECDALWAALADGRLPMVASDHSPSSPGLKAGDAFAAWGGIDGIQTLVTLVLGDGLARGVAPATLVAAVASFPARRLRLAAKGRLEVGADADLALVAVGRQRALRSDELLSRHRQSPYVGRTVSARVATVLLRGQPPTAGRGRLVSPTPRSSP